MKTGSDVVFKNLEVGTFIPGMIGGSGVRMDENGYAEMTGLTLREFLEVPELRFNRVDVVSGELWNSIAYGTVESVEPTSIIAPGVEICPTDCIGSVRSAGRRTSQRYSATPSSDAIISGESI